MAKARLDVRQNRLVAEGGLRPSVYLRDGKWNLARLRYDIAKRRLERLRKEDQLRWEREQAWNLAHERHDSENKQVAANSTQTAICLSCAEMTTPDPKKHFEAQVDRNTTWWEAPGALAPADKAFPKTPSASQNRQRRSTVKGTTSNTMCSMIHSLRASRHASKVQQAAWETRYKTESAVRRKHGLGGNLHIAPNFWSSPISGLSSRLHYEQSQTNRKMDERRARGNTPRARPPRSSLSNSRSCDDVEVDLPWLTALMQTEERDLLERETQKVAEEVGYLYFRGPIHIIQSWDEDLLRSDRRLVVRTHVADSETSDTSGTESDGIEEDEEEEKEKEKEGGDKMDVD